MIFLLVVKHDNTRNHRELDHFKIGRAEKRELRGSHGVILANFGASCPRGQVRKGTSV